MDELVVIDAQGHVHSACLHWDGLPRRLWELLSAAGYPQPLLYDGHDFVESGVRRCSVTMVIPQHPLNGWEPIVSDSCDRPPTVGHLGDHCHAGNSHFLYSAPVGGSSVRVWVVSRTRSGRPSVAQQEGQRGHDCDPRPLRSDTDDRVVLDALYRL